MGGSNIIGLQKWVGPVPPTYNSSDTHKHIINKNQTMYRISWFINNVFIEFGLCPERAGDV